MRHERPYRPVAAYFRQLAWTLLLFNLVLGLVGWLLAEHLGTGWALGLFLGTGLVASAALLLVVGANYLLTRLHERRESRPRDGSRGRGDRPNV